MQNHEDFLSALNSSITELDSMRVKSLELQEEVGEATSVLEDAASRLAELSGKITELESEIQSMILERLSATPQKLAEKVEQPVEVQPEVPEQKEEEKRQESKPVEKQEARKVSKPQEILANRKIQRNKLTRSMDAVLALLRKDPDSAYPTAYIIEHLRARHLAENVGNVLTKMVKLGLIERPTTGYYAIMLDDNRSE